MSLTKRLVSGWGDLHVAAAAGDLARVRHVVQKSPTEIDRMTKERQTALHLAAAAGFEAVVGELLDRQARSTAQDEAGRTPLHAAAYAGHARCVAALLGPRNREPPLERARLLTLADREGRDALGAAVAAGHAAAVEELMRGGADAARCRDQSGCGLMLLAVRLNHIHLLPLLAPACGLEQRDPATGGTPLHAAAVRGATGTAEWLLRSGANAATRDNAGRTPAEAALAAGQHAACKAIREAAAAAAAPGGRPSSASTVPYDHSLLAQTSARPSSSGGGGAVPAAPYSGGPGYSAAPYGGPPPYGAAPPPAGPGLASSTPWQQFGPPPGVAPAWQQQQQQQPQPPGAGVAAPGAMPGAGGVGGRIQVPDQPPPSVYYPQPLPGAGVYF